MVFQILMVILGIWVIVFMGFIVLVARAHKKSVQGKALIRTGFGGAIVALDSGMFVIPFLHQVEELDIALRKLSFETEVETKEGELAHLTSSFYVRVNKDPIRLIEVAQTVGCERASKDETYYELFSGKFTEALKIVAKEYSYEDLKAEREHFKRNVLKQIPEGLNGFVLDDMAVEKISRSKVPDLGHAFFVMLDSDRPLEKGEKVYVVDKINDGKSYIVRRI